MIVVLHDRRGRILVACRWATACVIACLYPARSTGEGVTAAGCSAAASYRHTGAPAGRHAATLNLPPASLKIERAATVGSTKILFN
jgi:hypothetical protein